MVYVYSCSHSNGDRYEGEWVQDKKQGQGIFRTADGTIYDVRTLQHNLWCSICFKIVPFLIIFSKHRYGSCCYLLKTDSVFEANLQKLNQFL